MTIRFRDVDQRDLDHQIARVAGALLFITLADWGCTRAFRRTPAWQS